MKLRRFHRQRPTDVSKPTKAEERRRKLIGLKVTATHARQAGVPDSENEALQAIRAAGILPPKVGLVRLKELDLVEPLLARMKRKRPLYTLDLLLRACQKDPADVTTEDVDRYVAGQRYEIESLSRSDIRLSYEALIALGRAQSNPSPKRGHHRPVLPEPFASDMAKTESWEVEQGYASGSMLGTVTAMRRAVKWALERGHTEKTLNDLLWGNENALNDLALWWAGPTLRGEQRFVCCMEDLFSLLKHMFNAYGRPVPDTNDLVRRLKRKLRRSGDDYGALDRLNLRDEDPPPAPAEVRCERLVESYAAETAQLRAQGPDSKPALIELQQERLLFLIFYWVGVRRASLASFRYEMLKQDQDGFWYFDWCVTKRTKPTRRKVVKTWSVGNVTFSEWFIPPEFYDVLVEAANDEGIDLERYLKTKDRALLPWVVARDDTFGPQMKGKPVAAVWHGKRGHLGAQTIYKIVAHILRDRLGLERGGPHALRRRSIVDKTPLANRFPQAGERLQHLTPESRLRYHWTVERSVGYMLGATTPERTEQAPVPQRPTDQPRLARRKTSNRRRPVRPARLRIADLG